MKKRFQIKTGRMTALVLSFAMLIQLTACGSDNSGGGLIDEPGHGKWVDSDIKGYVKAEDEIRLQDDFAAAANKEAIVAALKRDEMIWANDMDASDMLRTRFREILRDESVTGPNVEVMRTFESLVLDWDNRNKLGVEPIRKYIDDIQSISSIDDMTAYQASPERNPFNLGLFMPGNVKSQELYVDKSTLELKTPAYSLGNKESYLEYSEGTLEIKEVTDDTMAYLLGRLGYDDKTIKDTLKGCYEIEQFLAENDCTSLYNRSEIINQMQTDRAGLESYTNGYPLFEILDGRGFSGVDSFCADYKLLSRLNKIYDRDHLQDLKSFLTVHMLRYGYSMLDQETIEKVSELGESKSGKKEDETAERSDDQIFTTMVETCSFRPVMDQLYLEKYFPDDEKTDKIRNFIDSLKDSYRTMINEEDWLSEETKAAAIQKLDNMVVQVVRPSNTADYSSVTVKSYEEGGTILDAAASAARLTGAHMAERASDPAIDRVFWDIYDEEFSTTKVNCFYRPERNSIFMMAGFVAIGDTIYGDDITDEEFMGCVGAVAGHEISHGFDGNGSHYDLYGRRYGDDGNETDWMSTDDRSRIDERIGRVGSYFSLARPIPGERQVEGIEVMNEATADIAGVKSVLYMARDMEGFDYDRFFRAFAALYATQTQEKFEIETLSDDNHPLNFHRVNITLQQFDEFYQTYDIKPGDGMYLDPERRINVW